jgi:hypothetical protein
MESHTAYTAKRQADQREAKRLVDLMKRIGRQVRALFDEVHFYTNLKEPNPSPRLTNDEIRAVIVSGMLPWDNGASCFNETGDASLLYWGRKYFELTENLARNEEEAPELVKCWYRLEWWITELLENISKAQRREGAPTIHSSLRGGLMMRHAQSHLGSGRWFLLQHEADRYKPLLKKVKENTRNYVERLNKTIKIAK